MLNHKLNNVKGICQLAIVNWKMAGNINTFVLIEQ
jgi:hypothetical protein